MTEKLVRVPLAELSTAPQARAHLGPVRDLAKSIAGSRHVEPLSARRVGGRLVLLTGHRRLAALRLLATEHPDDEFFSAAPVVVRELDDAQAQVVQLAENSERLSLSWLDWGRQLAQLTSRGITQAELARRLGKSENWVSQRIKVATWLHPSVAETIEQHHLAGTRPLRLHDALLVAQSRDEDKQRRTLEKWHEGKKKPARKPRTGGPIPRSRAEALLARLERDPLATRREKQIVRWLLKTTTKNPLAVGQRNPPPMPDTTD
jgi:ParB/RepB/Spo0J family partition protein